MKSAAPKKDKAIGIRLPLETYDALKARADAERRSLSNYLQILIERDLETYRAAIEEPGKITPSLPIPALRLPPTSRL